MTNSEKIDYFCPNKSNYGNNQLTMKKQNTTSSLFPFTSLSILLFRVQFPYYAAKLP